MNSSGDSTLVSERRGPVAVAAAADINFGSEKKN